MSLRQIVDDEDSVRIALVVGSDDIWVIGGKILFPDAFHVTQDMSEKKEAVLGNDIPKTSFGGIFLIKLAMVLSVGQLLFAGILLNG